MYKYKTQITRPDLSMNHCTPCIYPHALIPPLTLMTAKERHVGKPIVGQSIPYPDNLQSSKRSVALPQLPKPSASFPHRVRWKQRPCVRYSSRPPDTAPAQYGQRSDKVGYNIHRNLPTSPNDQGINSSKLDTVRQQN